jgi:hypothetical protein
LRQCHHCGRHASGCSELKGEALLAMGEGGGRLPITPYDAPAAGVGGPSACSPRKGAGVAIECIAVWMTHARRLDGFVVERGRAVRAKHGRSYAGCLALRPEARNGASGRQAVALGGSFHQPTLASAPDAASLGGMADRALYPLRRFFAGLAAEPANACLGSLPAPPRKRVPAHERPIAQRPQPDVQQAGGRLQCHRSPPGGPTATDARRRLTATPKRRFERAGPAASPKGATSARSNRLRLSASNRTALALDRPRLSGTARDDTRAGAPR